MYCHCWSPGCLSHNFKASRPLSLPISGGLEAELSEAEFSHHQVFCSEGKEEKRAQRQHEFNQDKSPSPKELRTRTSIVTC